MLKNNHELTAIIDRLEDGQVVLKFEFAPNNCKELIIPKRYLPKNVSEGVVLHFEVYNDEESTQRRKNLARQVLEEILKAD